METRDVLELIGLLIVFIGLGGTTIKWLMNRMNTIDLEARQRDDHALTKLAEYRDDTVRKDDMLMHINRIERGQENLQAGIDRVHARMDGWTTIKGVTSTNNGNKS